MMLSYYRNGLAHIFLHEAEVMTAVYHIAGKRAASFEEVFEATMFIKDLLRGEFVVKDRLKSKEDLT
jgi:glycerol-3-phosphate O-acyltransferase